MPLPSTLTPIATNTLTAAAASVTFSGIPQNYTDLVLVVSAGNASSSPSVQIQLNGDTGSNYSYTVLAGNGSAASSARGSNLTSSLISYFGAPFTTLGQQTLVTNIMNYSNTTTNKTFITRANNATFGTDAMVGLWRSTSAVNSFTLTNSNATNFVSGSTFNLYGVKAA